MVEVIQYAYTNIFQTPLEVFIVRGNAKALGFYCTSKADAKRSINILPDKRDAVKLNFAKIVK